MDEKLHLYILQQEIAYQSKFVILSFEQIQRELNGANSEFGTWYAIHSFFIASANISKLLWPSRPQFKELSEKLKKSLNVKDDSFLNSKDLKEIRNAFEHKEDRLSDWLEGTTVKSGSIIYSVSSQSISNVPIPIFLNFNPKFMEVTYRDKESCKLEVLLKEVQNIHEEVKKKTALGPYNQP